MKNFLIDKKPIKWIWQTLKKRKVAMLFLIVIQVINGLLITERSLVLKEVIDHASSGIRNEFIQSLFVLIGLFIIQLAILSYYRHIQAKTQYGMEMDLKYRVYQTLLEKDYASVKTLHTGQWNQRMTSDTSTVASLSVNTLPGIIGLVVRLTSALIALLYLVPALVLLMIPFSLCLLGVTFFLKKYTKRMYNEIQDADGKFRIFLQEHLGNLMMIRVFNKEEMSLLEGKKTMDAHYQKIMKRNTFMIYVGILGSLAFNGMYLLGVILGGLGILKGSLSYGTFSAILTLVMQAQSQISGATSYFSNIFNLTASAERLMEAEAYKDDQYEKRTLTEIEDYYNNELEAIELQDAAFSYMDAEEGQQVFTHKNMYIKKGEFVALTGESGCGKSTILKVLMSIYPLEAGKRVLINKNSEIELDGSYRSLFAYVPQGNQLMTGTIKDVIAFGETVDEQKLEQAIEIACAKEFIDQTANGIETMLGEKGSGLSEGQMQRISIARAIYSQRPILLLDESTSALDQETEQKLLSNIQQMTNKTVVIVTHRMATLEYCDRVIEFKKEEL